MQNRPENNPYLAKSNTNEVQEHAEVRHDVGNAVKEDCHEQSQPNPTVFDFVAPCPLLQHIESRVDLDWVRKKDRDGIQEGENESEFCLVEDEYVLRED